MYFNSTIKNKVVLYLASRYITYFIQFVTSMAIAAKLGPYYLGVWGAVLLIINYFQQLHFGIPNSFNVLYVQHKNDILKCNDYIANSILLTTYLLLLVIVFYILYNFIGISSLEKYQLDKYFVWICLIVAMQYFVQYFINLFRVKNKLNRITFCQTIIVLLCFISVFLFKGETLISALVGSYFLGNCVCIIIALSSGTIPSLKAMHFRLSCQKEIIRKGIYLFLYNSCFYFIIIIARTFVSSNYTIEEFGLFTFYYSLAHAILLVLEAMTFIIFPKIIGKLSSSDLIQIKQTIHDLRTIYLTTVHLLMYVALPCIPVILFFLPKYSQDVLTFNLIALSILLSRNSYGYLELLVSKGKEKLLAMLSASALIINTIITYLFVTYLHLQYSYIIIATLITYILFSYISGLYSSKLIGNNKAFSIFKEIFPLNFFLPYLLALFISLMQYEEWIWIPLILFCIINWKNKNKLIDIIKTILVKPEVVDIK